MDAASLIRDRFTEQITNPSAQCNAAANLDPRLPPPAKLLGTRSDMRTQGATRSMEERFWAKVDKRGDDECWPWVGAIQSNGYGKIGIGRRGEGCVYAHRVSYELTVGPIPDGFLIDHVCHNRACVNPLHLRVCTHTQNSQNQALRKTSSNPFKGVYQNKEGGSWYARIAPHGGYVHLGFYPTPELAHAAYCEAAIGLYGEFANLG